VAVAAAIGLLATRPAPLPQFAAVRAAWVPSDAWLLDRHGEVLDSRRLDASARRLEWTPLAAVSPALVAAVVEGEDRRFHAHRGVDWRATLGALRDAARGRRRGASTISMQTASLIAPAATRTSGGRGLAQKLRQMRLALQLERQWSKAQILEVYLNTLPFRGELQGIGAAAALLAGKSPAGLTADESRILAALLPQPSASPARVARRACARLPAGQCGGLQATAARLLAGPRARLDSARLTPQLANSLLRAPGERVRTTVDAGVQRIAHAALARQLAGLEGRNVRDGAALVVDNASGEVLAYVGSAGPDSTAAAVDGVRARRQAGSTLKPFLYALALERRYLTAASLLDDSPVSIDTPNGIYLPRDYDHRYKGPVSVRTALAGSLNVPAVRALMLVGVEDFRDRLNALGYAGIDRDGAYYGFALALGSAEVSLWEQATAFRALALHGRASPLRVRLGEPAAPLREVLPANAAFVVADVLSDGAARAVTFGLDSSLATPYWSAVKTGTSKDMRDNWCIGFSRDYTVAVWVGNFEGDSMHDVSGVSGAAPTWRGIMDALHADGAPSAPQAPAGVSAQPLRFANGIEPPRVEWYLDGTAPGGVVHAVDARVRPARISSPVDGMVVALDPDIPPGLQRVPIAVDGAGAGHTVVIDGESFGPVGGPLLWRPTAGTHRIALADPAGRIVDRLSFTVR
jgi:penicillin-binding protein 1C